MPTIITTSTNKRLHKWLMSFSRVTITSPSRSKKLNTMSLTLAMFCRKSAWTYLSYLGFDPKVTEISVKPVIYYYVATIATMALVPRAYNK